MPVSEPSAFTKLSVTFLRREDGGLRVYSDDVPGFMLSHADPAAVMRDVRPALEFILGAMLNAVVKVAPLHALKEKLRDVGVLDPDMPTFLYQQEYVSQRVTG